VTDEISYKAGVMTVEMTIEHGIPMDFSCECEEFRENQQNALKSINEKKCRHIREAEMYHHCKQKVAPVEND